MNEKTLLEFCTGCGACVSYGHAIMEMNTKGFCIAKPLNKEFSNFCKKVCFSSGEQYRNYNTTNFWGNIIYSAKSWSTDAIIRHNASSGGTLTSLCTFLLEEGLVDGIVQTKEDPLNPIRTITVCSRSAEEVKSCCGSRYSTSSPLKDILKYTTKNEKYCFVGKPCDVAALRNMSKSDYNIKKHFPYMFSFFCAGSPSENANLLLLNKMGTSLEKCSNLKYRGDGWPGYATATDINGEKHTLYYRTAWRDTLGRDIRNVCRFCIDGIGEMADIVCYDAWYMDKNKQPIFDEADGRNGVLCRSKSGFDILKAAEEKGYIQMCEYSLFEQELPFFQKYQYTRRATMASTMMAMKTLLRNIPHYPLKFVIHMMRYGNFRTHLSRYKGTIKRILKGNI